MNKKGFTLVELIAVIAVIALILIITVTSIGKTIDKQRIETYKDSVNGLSTASEMFSIDLTDSNLTNGYYVFYYNNNKLAFNTEEIETTSKMEDTKGVIYVDANGNSFSYMYIREKYCYNSTLDGTITVTTDKTETECLNNVSIPEL